MRPLVLVAMMLAAGSAGCETLRASTCDPSAEANPTVTYAGGTTKACVYTSTSPPDGGAPWGAELLYFPGGMHYQLALPPDCQAEWVQAYLSFDRFGTLDGGSLAQSAGNQVEILGPSGAGDGGDASILIANDSCVDYWILVVAGIAQSATCDCQ